MTPERLAEIERLANEATPGPWEWDLDVFNEDGEIESCVGAGIPIAMLFRAATGLKTTTDGNTRETWHKAEKAQEAKDAAYIAAANPAALLDLIAHIRDLEAQVREAREFYERASSIMETVKGGDGTSLLWELIADMTSVAAATPPSLSAKERQRRSFAYGNVHIDNPNVTREMVDRAAERLASEPPSPEVGTNGFIERAYGEMGQ